MATHDITTLKEETIKRLELQKDFSIAIDKLREAVRVMEKRLIKDISKNDKHFKEDLNKAITIDWPSTTNKLEYLNTAAVISHKCMKNHINKITVTKFLKNKGNELKEFYKYSENIFTVENYQEQVLTEILKEFILTTATRKSIKPRSVYIDELNGFN